MPPDGRTERLGRGRSISGALAVVLTLLITWRAAAEEKPFGLTKRPVWTNSRLVGSPEPPLPYTVEKTFTKVSWSAPLYLADEPSTDRLWIVQQGGEADRPSTILRIKNDTAATDPVTVLQVPQRLFYSVAFHPRYADNGYVFVFSNGPTGQAERTNRISRYTVKRDADGVCDPATETVIIEWSSAGHDGGDMAFSPEGLLYITTGDGTSDSDGWNSGQTLDDLLGAVLRIDVDHPSSPAKAGSDDKAPKHYGVPPDNPFIKHPGARPEIWAYGLRNPWRMAIDGKSGQVWVGTNGQDLWETAHLVARGDNLGWSVYEGSHPFYLNRKLGPTPPVKPTIEHPHSEFRSLTGGVVYRGDKFPALDGAYIYGDYSTGRIWAMKHDGTRPLWHRELADTSLMIAAFRCVAGELFVVDHGGGIYRLVPTPVESPAAKFPGLLSETGLFDTVREHRPAAGLIPYSVNAAGWADGAQAQRYAAVPGEKPIEFAATGGWTFPNGTALVQTLSLERETGKPATRFRIETRVLLRQQGEWAGYTYRWNDEQTDAALVPKEGAQAELTIQDPRAEGGRRSQPWRFPSRSECMTCHSRQANFVLGLSEAQMNRDHDYGGVRDNQLRAWEHAGLFAAPLSKPPAELTRLTDPYDASAPVDARARSYLHANCSVCHVVNGGGNAKMMLEFSAAADAMNVLAARPQHDTFAIADAMIVAPGDPDRSILVHRVARRGKGQMPPLVSARIDEQAVQLLRAWIAPMKPARPLVKAWQANDFADVLEELKTGCSLKSGQTAFRDIGCNQCHRIAGEGGSVGPDLTGIARRQTAQELLKSILLPSDKIADEYATHQIETADGRNVVGRIEREDDAAIVIRPQEQPATPQQKSSESPSQQPLQSSEAIRIAKTDVAARQRLLLSNMPTGIINVLKREEVLDLLAYLLADGNVGEEPSGK